MILLQSETRESDFGLSLQHLAALYVLAASVLSLLTHCAISTIPFVLCGAYAAWFYLRFHQPSSTDAAQQYAFSKLPF